MKTLNDFKNKIQLGTKIKGTHHFNFMGRDPDGSPIYGNKDLGTREVTIKQSNSFALKTIRTNGEIVNSYCQYPKSSELIFNGLNSVTILEKQTDGKMLPVLTYEFID